MKNKPGCCRCLHMRRRVLILVSGFSAPQIFAVLLLLNTQALPVHLPSISSVHHMPILNVHSLTHIYRYIYVWVRIKLYISLLFSPIYIQTMRSINNILLYFSFFFFFFLYNKDYINKSWSKYYCTRTIGYLLWSIVPIDFQTFFFLFLFSKTIIQLTNVQKKSYTISEKKNFKSKP